MKRQVIINYEWCDSKEQPVKEYDLFVPELENYSIEKIGKSISKGFKKGFLEIEIDAGEFIYEYNGEWSVQ